MKKSFKRNIQSLNDIFQFINEFDNHYKLSNTIRSEVQLVVEEIFTNLVKYHTKSAGAISLELKKKGQNLYITLSNPNGEPYKLEAAPRYDTSLPLDKRPIGKLGILLVRKYVDDIQYRQVKGLNIIKLKKILKDRHV